MLHVRPVAVAFRAQGAGWSYRRGGSRDRHAPGL